MVKIDKDTVLCCSFAERAGSFGCFVHNNAFKYHNLNYIYKSFAVNHIGKALDAMRSLNIRGAGVTMPFKQEVIKYLDKKSDHITDIGACNTVVNRDGILYGENTDFLGLTSYFSKKNIPKFDEIYIIGNGGMSLAVQSACKKLDLKYKIITRNSFEKLKNIKNSYIFNATPLTSLEVCKSNNVVHASVSTNTGMHLAILQASFQFNLYTEKEFPIEYIFQCVNEKFNLNIY